MLFVFVVNNYSLIINRTTIMKKLIYIFVPLILLGSLMPILNYSSPAAALEIVLESPGASEFDLVQSRAIIANRLEAYGISDFEISILADKHQLNIILPDVLAEEPLLPLLVDKGALFFCATFNRAEMARMLEHSPYRQKWREWLTADAESLGKQGNNALLAEVDREKISAFNIFLEGPDHLQGLPSYLHFAFGRFPNTDDQIGIYALKLDHENRILLSGKAVKEARVLASESTGAVSISLDFYSEGTEQWAKATRENINRSIAIVIDELVYFAPRVMTEMTDGQATITGQFSMQEAKTLAAIVQGGELPVAFILK